MASTKISFDPPNKLITVIEAPTLVDGEMVVAHDVKIDFYSDGKEDWLADPYLNRFIFPFESVGGDPTVGSKALGATYFMRAGWKIRPYEASHVYRVNGNFYTRDGSSPYTSTLGTYSVNIESTVSSLVDSTVQQLAEIEYASFGGGVSIDTQNVTGTAGSGTDYPAGTLREPCLDISDALVIAANRGFLKLFILGAATFTSAHDIDGFIVEGQSHVQNDIILNPDANCTNTVFKELEVQGQLDGNNELNSCILHDLFYFSGHIHNSGLSGTITLAGGLSSVISECKTIDPFSPPIIDMGGSGQDLAMSNYSGLLTITNFNGADNFAGIGLTGGTIIVDLTTVTAGTIQCAGVGNLIDQLGNNLDTGMHGNVMIFNQTVTEDIIAAKVWTEVPTELIGGSYGELINNLLTLTGNKVTRAGEVITVYEADGVTVYAQYDLTNGQRIPI